MRFEIVINLKDRKCTRDCVAAKLAGARSTRKTLIAITTMSLLLCTIVGMSLFAGYSDHERCMLSLGGHRF
jgi:hypothetical protein